jgi:hypothetical protein
MRLQVDPETSGMVNGETAQVLVDPQVAGRSDQMPLNPASAARRRSSPTGEGSLLAAFMASRVSKTSQLAPSAIRAVPSRQVSTTLTPSR